MHCTNKIARKCLQCIQREYECKVPTVHSKRQAKYKINKDKIMNNAEKKLHNT